MPVSKNLSNVNVGTTPNAGDGDILRDAFIKVNENFNSLYSGGQIFAYGSDQKLSPGFTWAGDKDTGMFRKAAGQIGFSLNGVESLLINEDGTITWYNQNLATQDYVTAQITNFTGGVSAANIVVNTGSGNTTVTINGVPVVSALPTVGNEEGRIVFYTGDIWIYSRYPIGNGAGLAANPSISRLAGSDLRWDRFRGTTAFTIGTIRPISSPEGTLFYETGNSAAYVYLSGTWKTLSSVIAGTSLTGIEVLVSLPAVGNPANYSGRTVVVGSVAYIFISGAWQTLASYVSGASGSSGIGAGATLPSTLSANVGDLFRKTGTNAGLYIFDTSAWRTISAYTGNTVIARVPTLSSLPSDISNYNAGDLIIVGGTSYILNTAKTSWNFYTPGVSGSVTGIVLNAGQVGNVELASNAVITSKIASNVIIGSKLVSNTITTREIADFAITSAKLSTNSVTSTKIQDNSITGNKLAANTIDGTKIVAGTIQRAQLAPNIFTGISVSANNLSEISQNLGTVTTGVLRSTDGRMVIDLNSKFIRIEI
jgi:hypothetical protein